ncbi:MAG: RagB/SusD family nutrient uptake outer membrane protein, partial [Chitinophagaceae bacterium]
FNDIRGGDFNNERTNVVTGFDVWNYTPSNSSTNSVQNHWSRAYYVINLANVFLDGMATKGTNIVGAALSNNYQAEARLLRAMSYYSLLQLYARPYWDGNGSKPGVPLRLKGNTGSDDYALARASVAEVYNQILADLNFA